MAEKKTETVKKTEDKAAGKVTITLPAPTDPHEPNYQFVSVNGKNYKIMKGEPVEVPEAVALVVENARRAKQAARAYSMKKMQ